MTDPIARMIDAGQLSPAARAEEPASVLAIWRDANALDAIEAATEAATYGVRSVVMAAVRWTDCTPDEHTDAEERQSCEQGDHLGATEADHAAARYTWEAPLDVEEAVEAIRMAGLTFEGAEWASDPDGSQILDYATGEQETATAHLYGWTPEEVEAIVTAVNAR